MVSRPLHPTTPPTSPATPMSSSTYSNPHRRLQSTIKTIFHPWPNPTNLRQKSSSRQTWHTAEYLPLRTLNSPLADVDTAAKIQIILRPRPAAPQLTRGTPNRLVYYYDPSTIVVEEGEPTLTLPEVIYDEAGRETRLIDLHDGGRNEVFLEVTPRAVWGESWQSTTKHWNDTLSALETTQSPDQMIVFGTIATMAVLVGALSARRCRHRKLLEHCVEPDLEEWEEGEERGAPPMGRMRRGREGFGGDLHWRGDMEKFDV